MSYFASVFSCHVCILHSLHVVHFNFFLIVIPSSCSFCVLLVSNMIHFLVCCCPLSFEVILISFIKILWVEDWTKTQKSQHHKSKTMVPVQKNNKLHVSQSVPPQSAPPLLSKCPSLPLCPTPSHSAPITPIQGLLLLVCLAWNYNPRWSNQNVRGNWRSQAPWSLEPEWLRTWTRHVYPFPGATGPLLAPSIPWLVWHEGWGDHLRYSKENKRYK